MDIRRKRMLFHAWHRGFKEMDLILGSFADRRLADLREDELAQFEAILGAVDGDLYSWITGKTPLPVQYDNAIMAELRTFKPLADVLKSGKSS